MQTADYQRVVREQKDRVFSFAAHLLRDREEARDIAQEALVRLWQHRETVHDDASARAWLMRTAHHLCIDRVRQRRGRPEADVETIDSLSDRNPSPEQAATGKQVGGKIAAALARLTTRDRSLVLMRDVNQMSYEEIAAALGMPLGTLKAALHRARERCRQELISVGVQP
jgi:RNA polymerase sigma-70 factor (ECF subfamily)